MRHGTIDIIAPLAAGGTLEINEAEVLGSAVWLWMHSSSHRNAPLHTLAKLLVPAIKSRQFVLASENGRPVFYLSWANFSSAAEARYIENPPECMPLEDWACGDQTWILDWVAPFGHTWTVRRLLKERLFPGRSAKSLNHRGSQTGLRVMTFRGTSTQTQ